jgi:hypothetical protein
MKEYTGRMVALLGHGLLMASAGIFTSASTGIGIPTGQHPRWQHRPTGTSIANIAGYGVTD